MLQKARSAHHLSAWWIGDIMVSAEEKLGEECSQLYEAADESLRQYQWMAERFPPGTRVPGVSYSHHRMVSKFSDEVAQAFLESAKDSGWSKRDLRLAIKNDQEVDGSAAEPDVTDSDAAESNGKVIKSPDEIREEAPTAPPAKELSATILAKQLQQPYGQLVRGIDKIASANGGKGDRWDAANELLIALMTLIQDMGEGEQ